MDNTLQVLFIFCLIIACYYLTQLFSPRNTVEGFQQDNLFQSFQNNYDNYYLSMYDKIYKTKDIAKYDISKIIEFTLPSNKSVFLDVGSNTGKNVHYLNKKGYSTFGIDSSKAMIDYSQYKYPKYEFTCESPYNRIQFDPSTFSYVLCTHFTIYEMDNKDIFFANVFYWLRTGGYFIVHLVNKDKFDMVVPIAKPYRLQKKLSKRITDTSIHLNNNVHYKSSFTFPSNNHVIHKETFTNKNTKQIKYYEKKMFMEPIKDIISKIKHIGFYVKGFFSYYDLNEDSEQFLYIFEKLDI